MGLLPSIELPHWLMIGGAILIAMGLALTRNKEVSNPDSEPPVARPKMPPLPLDSSSHKGKVK